jgi:xanthine/uracil permease
MGSVTDIHPPPALASRGYAGFAAALVGGVVAIGVAIGWGVLTNDPEGQVAVLAGAVLAAGIVGVVLAAASPRWRRFGSGLVVGSVAMLTAYVALAWWIASHIEA